MINMVGDWLAQGALVEEAGRWHLRQALAEWSSDVPDTLRQLIEQQLGRLDPEDQAILLAGSLMSLGEFSEARAALHNNSI
jgi:hypothetical protein